MVYSKKKEVFQSLFLIFIFNYLWVFIHSYLTNYILFRPVETDLNIPSNIFLWSNYITLISEIIKYAFINTLSMFIIILVIIYYKNSDIKFQIFISIFIFVLNLLFSILMYFINKNIHISALNLFTYTFYFLIPWVLFLVIYNRYYLTGFAKILLYFTIGTFIFSFLFLMKNNYMAFKKDKFLANQIKNEKKLLTFKMEEKDDSLSIQLQKNAKKNQVKTIKQKYPDIRIYPFETGIVSYKISGEITAQETIYFDHHGLRELTITETNLGNDMKSKQMVLLDNKYIYIIDLSTKIGTIALSNLTKNISKDDDYYDILKYRLRNLDPVQLGMENYLGKNCKIWISKDNKIKIWTWKGIIMKKIIYKNKMPSVIYEAKDLKTDIKIPENKFRIPPDTKFIRYKKAPKK